MAAVDIFEYALRCVDDEYYSHLERVFSYELYHKLRYILEIESAESMNSINASISDINDKLANFGEYSLTEADTNFIDRFGIDIYNPIPVNEGEGMPRITFHPSYEEVLCFRRYQIRVDSELRKEPYDPAAENAENIEPLTNIRYPDFLIHDMNSFDEQLLVGELKTTPDLTYEQFISDINKLMTMRVSYGFRCAVFVAVNYDISALKRRLKLALHRRTSNLDSIKLQRDPSDATDIIIFARPNTNVPWQKSTLMRLLQN
jgi:hypothetical protein